MLHTPGPVSRPAGAPHRNDRRVWLLAAALALLMLGSAPVRAHGPAEHGAQPAAPRAAHGNPAGARKEQKPWGMAGDPARAHRTIELRMGDDMRFRPDRIEVRQGETVRFVVHNEGRLMHEFVLGDEAELDAHARLMEKHPNMEHDEPWMVHVEPGRRGELTWRFNRAGSFRFGCLIAGHYGAGMVGRIEVTPPR